jgi:hypothetical protein
MNWSDDIPTDDRHRTLSIIRTPPKGYICGIITSEHPVGCYTHYTTGRTLPCEGPTCPYCAKGTGNRWHGYLGLFLPTQAKHVIFECTAHAAQTIRDYLELVPKLRGTKLAAERRSYKANSAVLLNLSPANLAGIALPDEPDIRRILTIIWQLPGDALKQGQATHYNRGIEVAPDAMAAMRGPQHILAPGNGRKH